MVRNCNILLSLGLIFALKCNEKVKWKKDPIKCLKRKLINYHL